MNSKEKVARFFRTIRYLRPVQIYRRIWFRLARPRPDLSAAPTVRGWAGIWRAPARRSPSLVGPDCFLLLNEMGNLAVQGWDDPEKAKLWRYNQHYFDDMNAEAADERTLWHESLLNSWITENPPGRGPGWDPYPTSLRIVNWIKWSLAGNALPDKAIVSLAIQARWMIKRIEWHLLGNHLFANAKALVFAGLFFDGAEADNWLYQGLKILEREIAEQILSDGGHFELSPMYHALAVEDMLDLLNIAELYGRTDLVVTWQRRVPPMLAWLETMSHPDGQIAFFNDAAFGVAPSNRELLEYARRLDLETGAVVAPINHLVDSGYLRMSSGQFVLIADVGQIGPDYLPAHAHADTLSFELSFGGQRVLVNSGISEYGAAAERQRQRGTAAHNAVVVADENSSEVWAGFRVGRRARPLGVIVERRGGFLHAECSHDGYRHLKSRPMTHRSLDLSSDRFIVSDNVVPAPCKAEARYHLHPSIKVKDFTNDGAVLILPDGQSLILALEGGMSRLEETKWHPEFGSSQPNFCVVQSLIYGKGRLSISSY
jgi:uncharacterized heparinase superfamily protein